VKVGPSLTTDWLKICIVVGEPEHPFDPSAGESGISKSTLSRRFRTLREREQAMRCFEGRSKARGRIHLSTDTLLILLGWTILISIYIALRLLS